MEPATLTAIITLVTTLLSMVMKFAPDLREIAQNAMLLINKGDNLSEEDLKKIQNYTDLLMERLRKIEEERLAKDE